MAINTTLKPQPLSFGSMQSPNKQYSSLSSPNTQYSSLGQTSAPSTGMTPEARTALRALGARNAGTSSSSSLPGLIKPPPVQPNASAPIDTTGWSPTSIADLNSAAALGTGVQTTNGLIGTGKTQADPLIGGMGTAQTPAQIASATGQNTSTNATTGTTGASTGTNTSPQEILSGLVSTATTPNPLLTSNLTTQGQLPIDYAASMANAGNAPGIAGAQEARQSNLTNAYGSEMQGLGANIQGLVNLQGAQQTGLNEAGGLAQQTTSAPYGTPQMYTATGQTVDSAGAGGGAIVSQWANYLAGGGDPNQIPASVSGNSVLYGEVLNAAKQQNSNFDVNTALGAASGRAAVGAASGTAQASNIQTAGTAGVAANQAALNPAYQNYLSLQQTTQNIDSFGKLLTDTMVQGGINPSDVKFANAKLADIRNQLSSGQQAVYDNTLAGLRSRVSGLLAAGGNEIPTQITADATKILDGTLPLSSLTDVLNRIQQEGNALLTNAAGVVNTAYAGTQGNNTNQNANTNQPAGWY